MFDDSDGFPFFVGGAISSVNDVHPSGTQIFQLWQTYLSNVNPLLKITHSHTLQNQIVKASRSTTKIERPLEALMFAIYFIAVTSMSEDQTRSMFGEDRVILLKRYHDATQQALLNAGFMRATDMTSLQAFFLYLVRNPLSFMNDDI
jgi:hypothetical protein